MHYNTSIKTWAEEDRPREKLLLKGRSILSESELIAIIIGSGNTNQSAVELSKEILSSVDYSISKLAKLSVEELMRFNGIGEAKAISIAAALELGRRKRKEPSSKIPIISSSQNVYDLMIPYFEDLPHEEFWVIFLSQSNGVLNQACISKGGVSGTVADPKMIFKMAIEKLASSIVLCHNHPSGNLKPSQEDNKLTNQMVKTGKIIGIPILDHVIFTNSGFYSFVDNAMM